MKAEEHYKIFINAEETLM